MFSVHHNAVVVPSSVKCGTIVSSDGETMPDFSVSASTKDGVIHVSMANPYLDKDVPVELSFDSLNPSEIKGEILSAPSVNAYNDFGKEPTVVPAAFDKAKATGNKVKLTLPAASVVMLEIR